MKAIFYTFYIVLNTCLIGCLLPFMVAATPLIVKITQQADYQQFNYQFSYKTTPEQLQFAIDNRILAEHFRQFRRYQPDFIQQYIWRDIQQHVADYSTVQIQRLSTTSPLRFKLSGTDPAQVQLVNTELTALMTARQAYYLHDMYYSQFQFANSQLSIVPDHVRIAQDSLTDLASVANAIKQKQPDLTPRQMVGYIGNWLQQIPYQDLSDRQQSSGASFNVPLKVLAENRGDCDSKAVLLAALLRLVLPKVKLAIIYPPNHAILGIGIKPIAGDETTIINGQTYVLMDATGPALLKVGEISPQYRLYIANGQTDYRLF